MNGSARLCCMAYISFKLTNDINASVLSLHSSVYWLRKHHTDSQCNQTFFMCCNRLFSLGELVMLWCCHMKSYGQANLLPYGADMQIIFAREFLKEVRMKPDQVKYLVTNARNGMCQGHRAELFAVKAAQACAALAVSPPPPPPQPSYPPHHPGKP